MNRVEISDSPNGFLTFDLKEIIEALPDLASELIWYLLEIEAVGQGLHGESMLETEAKVESDAHGMKLGFLELKQFANTLEQTINAAIVGMSEFTNAPSMPLHPPYPAPYIALEAIDSSKWIVTSSEVSVINSVLEHFPNGAGAPA